MNGPARRGNPVRFSVFEVDLDSGELFKQGRKVKLQGQPFELLLALLDRPGEVVSREELKQKVWPSDTVVDFDHGLNRAINKVREALGDSAESPHFVETLPRRGYRFLASIQEENGAPPAPIGPLPVDPPFLTPSRSAADAKGGPRRRTWLVPAALVGSAVVVASLVIALRTGAPAPAQDLKLRQLTTNSPENPVSKCHLSGREVSCLRGLDRDPPSRDLHRSNACASQTQDSVRG